MSVKLCRTCKRELPITAFPVQKKYGFRGDAAGSIRPDCKECTAANARAYRATRPLQAKRNTRDVDRYVWSACSCRVADANARNKRAGLPFDIDADYMYDLLQRQRHRCALTGCALSTDKHSPTVLSIDKVLPRRGLCAWECAVGSIGSQ